MRGVSFVIPVRNGGPLVAEALAAVFAEAEGREAEVIVVDDGSTDGSREVLARAAERERLTILDGGGRGPAAAMNRGIRAARHELIAQVDQDVVLRPGWLASLVEELEDEGVAAAQGYFEAPADATLSARVMGLDLEQRYGSIDTAEVNHVCTGNTLYRRSALLAVGGFDESLGYGGDVDLSTRLVARGHRLVFRRDARAVHHWRDDISGYISQQFGFGYGRLDYLAKHRRGVTGDDVARPAMMLHGPLTLVGYGAISVGLLGSPTLTSAGLSVLGALAAERLIAGLFAWRRFRDPAALLFPVFHLARDTAWCLAMVVFAGRRLADRPIDPMYSMGPAARPTGEHAARETVASPPSGARIVPEHGP